jgi:hypothetical protein
MKMYCYFDVKIHIVVKKSKPYLMSVLIEKTFCDTFELHNLHWIFSSMQSLFMFHEFSGQITV